MISLRKSISNDAQAREALNASMAAYLTTLDKMQRYAPPFQEGFVDSFRQNLKNIASALDVQTDPASLKRSATQVEDELKSLWEGSRGVVSRWQDDCKSLVKVLSEAARSLEGRDRTCNQIFHKFSERVEAIAVSSDMAEIRRRLGQELTMLKSSIDEMLRESSVVVGGMQKAAEHAESRFKQVQTMAFEDPLTSLSNRRHADAILQEKLRSAGMWSIILFDVDQFKRVNDAYGHACGDAVLKFVGEAIKKSVRATDVVARWAGDEFIAILNCDLLAALDISAAITRQWGPQRIEFGGKACDVVISASAGICQHIPGETLEGILVRVDEAMYREKAENRTVGLRR